MPRQKFLQDISGLQNLRTLRGEHFGSIPKVRRAHFLDLYVQEKERERLEQEIKLSKRKTDLLEKKLEKTLSNIQKIRGTINANEQENENTSQNYQISSLYMTNNARNKVSKKINKRR